MAMAGGRSADVGQGRGQVGCLGVVVSGVKSGCECLWSGKEQEEAQGS